MQKSLSSRRVVVISLGFAFALVVSIGCDSKGGDKKTSEESSSIAEQISAESEEKSEEEESGVESIDHGGITEIPDDPKLAEKGKKLFDKKGCGACHAANKKQVGPPLAGVTDRRDAKWIARMIQHPEEMLKKDQTARKLLQKYGARMSNQNVEPEETRALLAYLDTLESEQGGSNDEK